MKKKLERIRRAKSTRARIELSELPRLMVHRTNLHIYASVISSDKSKILVSVSTLESHMRDQLTGPGRGGNKKAASLVGEMVGKKLKKKALKKLHLIGPDLCSMVGSKLWPRPQGNLD